MVVGVDHDLVVVMGGPDRVEATAADWRAAAEHLATHVGDVIA